VPVCVPGRQSEHISQTRAGCVGGFRSHVVG
jgi:hypothetical protein